MCVDAVVVDSNDVWVRELTQRVVFALEHRDDAVALFARAKPLCRQAFQRDRDTTAAIECLVHHSHAAATELCAQLEALETLRRQRLLHSSKFSTLGEIQDRSVSPLALA
jgi:hypothetical protein